MILSLDVGLNAYGISGIGLGIVTYDVSFSSCGFSGGIVGFISLTLVCILWGELVIPPRQFPCFFGFFVVLSLLSLLLVSFLLG